MGEYKSFNKSIEVISGCIINIVFICGFTYTIDKKCGRCHNWVGIPGRPPYVIPRGSAGWNKKRQKVILASMYIFARIQLCDYWPVIVWQDVLNSYALHYVFLKAHTSCLIEKLQVLLSQMDKLMTSFNSSFCFCGLCCCRCLVRFFYAVCSLQLIHPWVKKDESIKIAHSHLGQWWQADHKLNLSPHIAQCRVDIPMSKVGWDMWSVYQNDRW